MAEPTRLLGELEDAKTTFVCKLDEVKVHFDAAPPTHCFLKFYWDEASKEETTFHTDTIKECAQHQAFAFTRDLSLVTKVPKTLGSHTFMIQVHGTVEKKKKLLGEARIDFGTLATGPRSYSLNVLTPELVAIGTVDFEMKVLEIAAKVEMHAVIEAKTSLQVPPEAARDGVCPTFEIYNKRYSPQSQEKEIPKPIESAKYKMPKKEKGDNSAATTKYPFDALFVEEQTIESLEDLWIRVFFEPANEKTKTHPLVGGESIFPLKYILSLDPTRPRTFTALVKKMAVNLVRYEVGAIEGKLSLENGPKFAQLIDAKFNGVKGLQGGKRIPGTVAPTIKRMPTTVEDVDHPASTIIDNNSPLIGDLQLDSIKPNEKAKVAEAKEEQVFEGSFELPHKKEHSRVNISTFFQQAPTPTPSQPSNPSPSPTPPRTQSALQPTPSSRVQITTATPPKPSTPKTPSPKAAPPSKPFDDDILSVVCGMCNELVPETEVVLTHKNKNYCRKCAKILVEKKKEMERAKQDLQQNPPPKVSPASSPINIQKAQSEFRSRGSASVDSIPINIVKVREQSPRSPTSPKKGSTSTSTPPSLSPHSNDYVDNLLAQLEDEVEKVDPKKIVLKASEGANRTSSSSPSIHPPKRSKEEPSPSRSPVANVRAAEPNKRHSSYAPASGSSNLSRVAPRTTTAEEDYSKGIQSRPLSISAKTPSTGSALGPVNSPPTVIHVPVPVPVPVYTNMQPAMMNPNMVMMGGPISFSPPPTVVEVAKPMPAPVIVKEQSKPKKVEPVYKEPTPEPKKIIPATNFIYNTNSEVRTRVIRDEPQVTGIQIVSTDNAAGGNFSADMVVKDMVITLPSNQPKNASLLVDAVELMEDKY